MEHFLVPNAQTRRDGGDGQPPVHKRRVKELLEDAEAEVLFCSCPPYSPDFSPIEEAFSKVKDILAPGRDLHPRSPAESDRLGTRCPKRTGRCGLVRTAATTLSIIIAMKTALKQFEEYQQVRQVS